MPRTPDQHLIDELYRELGGEDANGRPVTGSAGTSKLNDGQVLERVFTEEKRGAEFRDTYHGDYLGHHPDWTNSEAVASLLRKFAFYTNNDPVQMERLIRGSGLDDAKFDEARGGSTWLRDEIAKAIEMTTETYKPPDGASLDTSDSDSDYFHHTDGGFGGNKQSNESVLPIKSVDDVIAEAGEGVEWVVEDLLARGELTEFSGLAKKGGKTTFWCHAIAAGARGEDHGGFFTTPAKYLYLTEQGNNFAEALRESGLVEHPDNISVVQFKDVSARGWNKLMMQAGAAAKSRGFDALVIDTFAVFARLGHSEENDAGPVAERMRVLRLIAQKYNIAVVLIRHAGKDGTPRGSSAFEGEADICVIISRPEGRHAPSVRRIAGFGRHGEWERNIQLVDGRYVSLGTDNKIEFNKAVKFIKSVLPESPDVEMKKSEIMELRSGPDEDISASTIDRALAWLVKKEAVGEKELTHQRGKPKVYWKLEEVYFHQTSSPYGGNKSEGPSERTRVANVTTDEPWDVYIGNEFKRGKYQFEQSEWGNPFNEEYRHKKITLEESLAKYEAYIRGRLQKEPELRAKLRELKGERLGCWCAPDPCHGDVLVRLIEGVA